MKWPTYNHWITNGVDFITGGLACRLKKPDLVKHLQNTVSPSGICTQINGFSFLISMSQHLCLTSCWTGKEMVQRKYCRQGATNWYANDSSFACAIARKLWPDNKELLIIVIQKVCVSWIDFTVTMSGLLSLWCCFFHIKNRTEHSIYFNLSIYIYTTHRSYKTYIHSMYKWYYTNFEKVKLRERKSI